MKRDRMHMIIPPVAHSRGIQWALAKNRAKRSGRRTEAEIPRPVVECESGSQLRADSCAADGLAVATPNYYGVDAWRKKRAPAGRIVAALLLRPETAQTTQGDMR
jgi:hypothetical protein